MLNEIDENNKITDYDKSFYKSIMICNNLNNILLTNNFQNNNIKEFKKVEQILNYKKDNLIPANPPKKKNSINIIYHDENYRIFKDSINKDAKKFEEASNGTFIFSNSMEVLKTIMKEIYCQNDGNEKNKFLLITTGSTFEKVIGFLNQNNYIQLITNSCIYCMRREKYLPLMEKYKILGGVFNIPNSVIEFIKQNISEDNVLFEYGKLVTYKKYNSDYYKLHKIISKYYSNEFQTSTNIVIDL